VPKLPRSKIHFVILLFLAVLVFSVLIFRLASLNTRLSLLQQTIFTQTEQISSASASVASHASRIAELESEDQRLKNQKLSADITEIKKAYTKSVTVYENLTDLKTPVAKLSNAFAEAISLLAKENYASASSKMDQLTRDISAESAKQVAAAIPPPAAAPQNNAPPSAGYSRQTVSSDAGNFVVSIVSADLRSTRVIVDTSSDSDCGNNCPVLPLATYISRSGAFAGVNGSYFCPASYPTCSGKTNTFDLLVMNKNKYYFNSGNNVYSNNPAVIFGGGYIRFVSAVSQWGRDTGVDGVLSNYPLLVQGGNIIFGGNDDPKQGSKGNRSFVANKGNTVYIGVVHSATVAESARVLKSLGMENGLNLDDGGSTALYSGGYKVGPGRDLPNAILFVRK